jgi:hypothetical protein
MGSIQVDEIGDRNNRKDGSVGVLSTDRADEHGFRSFKIDGIASDQITPTGMREEILLSSWLIVLLRTREGGQIRYDWAYKYQQNGFKDEPINVSLSADEVMTGLQDHVGQIATAISRNISTVAQSQHASISTPASLFLSTGSLSKTPQTAKDEVS